MTRVTHLGKTLRQFWDNYGDGDDGDYYDMYDGGDRGCEPIKQGWILADY